MPKYGDLTELASGSIADGDLSAVKDVSAGASKYVQMSSVRDYVLATFPITTVASSGSTETLTSGTRDKIHNVTLTAVREL